MKWLKSLNRNTKLASSLVLILLVVGVSAAVLGADKNTAPEVATNTQESTEPTESVPLMGAKLTYIEGVVEHRDQNGEWATATKDSALVSGSGVRTTGASGRAIVTFDDGSIVRLDANTEIGFEQITLSRITIEQESGYIYSRVTESASRKYEVITENAQFQAVGTAFRTAATGDEESVEVFHSSVKDTTNNKTAKEGEKLIAKSNVNPDKDGTIEPIDIEKIKEETFITWNRDEDKKDNNFKSKLGFLNDFDGPKIESIAPASGSTIDIDATSANGSVSITGKTEKGAKLTIQSKSIPGNTAVEVPVGEDGTFDTGIQLGAIGNSVFELIAKDKVGNTTKLTVTYNFKKPIAVQQQGIALTVTETDDSVVLEWGLVGVSTPDGVKVLYAKDKSELTFENDAKLYVESGTTKSIKKSDLGTNKTYSFAVCRYDKEDPSCDIYSNVVKLEL